MSVLMEGGLNFIMPEEHVMSWGFKTDELCLEGIWVFYSSCILA